MNPPTLPADPVTISQHIHDAMHHAKPWIRGAWCAAYRMNETWWVSTYPKPVRAAARAAMNEKCGP